MNLDRMLLYDYSKNKYFLRFKFYGEFDTMKWIAADCIEDLNYIGNSNIDGAPIFIYLFNENEIDSETLRDFKKLSSQLRKLKIRSYTKKDLTKKEQSVLTFFNFFMNSDENRMIKGVSDFEIKSLDTIDDD